MFNGLSFDDLNALVKNKRAEPYEEYFSVMEISRQQKEDRISLSEDLEEVFLFILILLFTMQQYNAVNWELARKRLDERYREAVGKHVPVDDYLSTYITAFSYDTIDSTKRHESDPYYYSKDRGMYLAENEANLVNEHNEFNEAINLGKTKKIWIDVRDGRERETHLKVGGTVKKITEPFLVGDSLMMCPHDAMTFGADPKEYINCRCTAYYF